MCLPIMGLEANQALTLSCTQIAVVEDTTLVHPSVCFAVVPFHIYPTAILLEGVSSDVEVFGRQFHHGKVDEVL